MILDQIEAISLEALSLAAGPKTPPNGKVRKNQGS
jgi:hypothetical protein